MARSNCLLWSTPKASGALKLDAMAYPAGQRNALVDCDGQHRRPVARSNCLFMTKHRRLFDLGVAGVVFGVILTAAVLAAAMGGIYKFPLIVAFIRTKMGRTNEVVTPAAGISESAARGLELRAGSAASV